MKPPFIINDEEKQARSVEGSLSLMSIPDLIQWIERSRRSGTLMATNDEITRRFFFQNGSLIFLWGDEEGEEFCNILSRGTNLPVEKIRKIMGQANQLGISCLGFISSEEGIPIERITSLMATIAEGYLTTSFSWKTGHFRFSETLPATLLSSPVILNSSQILMESAVQYDETNLDEKASLDPVVDEIFELIRTGSVDIPPIPTDMQVLMNRISNPDLSVEEIIECINDPLLVSKILRICNSSYYGLRNKVGTLREAVVYMGIKSLTSIVTVHALSGFSPRNAEQVRMILHHSMMVGMIARDIAKNSGTNHEQAFICGLLHDLGWIVMLEMLDGYEISREKKNSLIQEHHTALGYLVAKSWNFSEDIQEVIRYHHDAASAQEEYRVLVENIQMADLLSKNEICPGDMGLNLFRTQLEVGGDQFSDHLEELDREIEAILTPSR